MPSPMTTRVLVPRATVLAVAAAGLGAQVPTWRQVPTVDQSTNSGPLVHDADQQARVLAELEPPSEGGSEGPVRIPAGAAGDVPFYLKLKELTVLGYYTSQVAAGTELDYQPVPGRYDGDARFDDFGRQWVR